MSEDDLREMGRRMQGKHPNTYTMTKAMAEWVVAEQADDIPAAIVRPSIGNINGNGAAITHDTQRKRDRDRKIESDRDR